MVSIKDIAKQAGVSISTVSYALNGSDKVTEETCARILAIAKELNYVPNAAARNLKKRETKIIGVFLTDFRGDVYGDLLYGIKEILNRKDYDLIVCSGKQSHRMLPERMIDGAIILDQTFDSQELLNYAERGHKMVVLDRELNHPNINQVLLDNKAGAALAVEHLLEMGHRKLYVVTGPDGSYDSRQRMQAVKQTIERSGTAEMIEIGGDFEKSGGEQAAEIILQQHVSPDSEPVAVFCLNDEMAVGFYNRMAQSELTIGQDIHIVGFDNIELAQYIQPRLTTIDYSKHKWGAVAAEQVLKIIAGEDVEHERLYVTLIQRESAGAVLSTPDQQNTL